MCALLLAASLACHCQDVVLIHGKRSFATEEQQIQELVSFYGLKLRTVDIGSAGDLMSQVRNPSTTALIVAEDALNGIAGEQLQSALRKSKRSDIPMLVFGIAGDGDAETLRFWSNGEVHGCAPIAANVRPSVLHMADSATLNRTLAGFDLPAVASLRCRLQIRDSSVAKALVIAQEYSSLPSPVLVRVQAKQTEVFFTPQSYSFDQSFVGQPSGLAKAFSSIAPFILFLDYAAGDYKWHLQGHYANFTIDDPWLTQPYGDLDYPALLKEMEEHNFHTTIAFVPWNFDRSESAVVALFREHPDRYSICLHGNNHTHREFGDYATNPLREQEAGIKQAVARMERFEKLTGVRYDRLMVFPHGVAPEDTFRALKMYGFSATANSIDVPLDHTFPTAPTFLLRPYTGAYSNLLSLSRYSVEAPISELDLAIESFLGNPLLFYGHHEFFKGGIGAFDEMANRVNAMQPQTRWASLGEVVRHLYQIRRREDGALDVQMLSREMNLDNPTSQEAVFYIHSQDGPAPAIASLTIDGSPGAFEQTANGLALHLIIPPHQMRKIRVVYESDLDLLTEDTRKTNLYAYALRTISDVRDLYLPRHAWGRVVVAAYYDHNIRFIELYLERKLLLTVTVTVTVLCVFLIIGLCYIRKRHKRHVVNGARAS
jgi:peptidoglycan/xylan/chitin deacetylase (PgdA/CDA1 family)